jgi:hypothetical protein
MAANLGSVQGTININAQTAIAQVNQLIASLQQLQATAGRPVNMGGITQGVSQAQAQVHKMGRDLMQMGAIVGVAFAGMGAVLLTGVSAAGELEQALVNVSATLGGLPQGQMEALSAEMRQLGIESQYSAAEVAGVAESLAKAGFGVEEIIGGMTEAVIDLAQATGSELDSAVRGIVQAMSI